MHLLTAMILQVGARFLLTNFFHHTKSLEIPEATRGVLIKPKKFAEIEGDIRYVCLFVCSGVCLHSSIDH